MTFKFIIVICVLQMIMSVICEDYRNNYARIKPARYYSNPPPRLYKLPPPIQSIRTPFSYTPPPEYMDQDHNYIRKSPKVSKHREGLGEEDFSNLIKHLSKQDLDRIVNLAAEKDRYAEQARPFEKRPSVYKNSESDFELNKVLVYSDDEQTAQVDTSHTNYVHIKFGDPKERDVSQVNTYSDSEETKQNELSYLNGFIQQELNADTNLAPNRDHHIYTSSETMKEEELPKPENLRENTDFEISYTNNVPTVVRSESSQYKLENFADLPLMNYENSKLETVNSYKVPHYTVTSSRNQIPQSFSSSISSPISSPIQVQPAPAKSAAAQESDAHLQAIKIWTHKSTGTAYTLHDDGSLSLERPVRPKRKF